MGDFPRHGCSVTVDGEEIFTMSPMSQLDCERTRCAQRSERAKMAANIYTDDYVQERIDKAHADMQRAMDDLAIWQLVAEAKRRNPDGHPR
jgi:hypothetical protein